MSGQFNEAFDHVAADEDDAEDDDFDDDDFDDNDDVVGARVSRAMIDNALARCSGIVGEGELDDDMMAAEDPAVVARGITAQDLLRIPGEWLGYDRLALLPDGTLIIDRLDSNEHQAARTHVFGACYTFVAAGQGRNLALGTVVNLGGLGPRRPDVVIEERMTTPNRRRVPRVIVEIVFESPTSDRYIDMATEYLRYNADIVRVIIFKFCVSPRRVNSRPEGLWVVPALAIVFGRPISADGVVRVEILQTQSFGNVGVPSEMVNSLCGAVHRELLVPLDPASGRALLAPGIEPEDNAISLVDDLQAMIDRDETLIFSVPIPGLDTMTFDLLAIFHEAVVGRESDEQVRQAGHNPRLVRRAARMHLRAPYPGRQERQAHQARQAAHQAAPAPGGQSPLPNLDLENLDNDEMEVLDQAAAHDQ